MAVLSLDHVSRERMGARAVPLAATAMGPGGTIGAGKASKIVSMKNGSSGRIWKSMKERCIQLANAAQKNNLQT